MDRPAALRDFVAKSPDDPFPRYGLAMELANRGQLDEACQAFQELLDRKPDYVPAYLMYGNTLARAGQSERAAEVYRSGAEVRGLPGGVRRRPPPPSPRAASASASAWRTVSTPPGTRTRASAPSSAACLPTVACITSGHTVRMARPAHNSVDQLTPA